MLHNSLHSVYYVQFYMWRPILLTLTLLLKFIDHVSWRWPSECRNMSQWYNLLTKCIRRHLFDIATLTHGYEQDNLLNSFYTQCISKWHRHIASGSHVFFGQFKIKFLSYILKLGNLTHLRHGSGTRRGAVGWGTALQAGRSRVPFPMVSMQFFIDIILPAVLSPEVDSAS